MYGFWQGMFLIMMRMTGFVMLLAPIGVFALIAKVVAISGFEGAGPLLLFAGCVVAGLLLYGFLALPVLLAIGGARESLARCIRRWRRRC